MCFLGASCLPSSTPWRFLQACAQGGAHTRAHPRLACSGVHPGGCAWVHSPHKAAARRLESGCLSEEAPATLPSAPRLGATAASICHCSQRLAKRQGHSGTEEQSSLTPGAESPAAHPQGCLQPCSLEATRLRTAALWWGCQLGSLGSAACPADQEGRLQGEKLQLGEHPLHLAPHRACSWASSHFVFTAEKTEV